MVASNVNSNDAALVLSAIFSTESKKTCRSQAAGTGERTESILPFTPFQVTGVNKIF